MQKHKLIELQMIIEETIGSLKEEVEIGTNVKLNPLYVEDRRDEIQFRVWTTRIIQAILNRGINEQQQFTIEIAEANHDFKLANQIRKQFVKLYDTEEEINAQYSKTKFK